MTDAADAPPAVAPAPPDAAGSSHHPLVSSLLSGLVAVGLLGWAGFWLVVARLHLVLGSTATAGFAVLAFVVPALLAVGHVVGPLPSVGVPVPSRSRRTPGEG